MWCWLESIWTFDFYFFKDPNQITTQDHMQCWVAQDTINGLSHMGSVVCALPAIRGWFIWLVDHVCPFVFVSCSVAQTSLSCGGGSRCCCHHDFREPVRWLETWFRSRRALARRRLWRGWRVSKLHWVSIDIPFLWFMSWAYIHRKLIDSGHSFKSRCCLWHMQNSATSKTSWTMWLVHILIWERNMISTCALAVFIVPFHSICMIHRSSSYALPQTIR